MHVASSEAPDPELPPETPVKSKSGAAWQALRSRRRISTTIKMVCDEAKADTPGFVSSSQPVKEAAAPGAYNQYETRMTAAQLRGLVTGAQVRARGRGRGRGRGRAA